MDNKINYFRLKTAENSNKYVHKGDYHKDFTVWLGSFDFEFKNVGYDVDTYDGSTPSGGPDPSRIEIEIYLTEQDCLKAMHDNVYEGADERIVGDTLYAWDGSKVCTAKELCNAAERQIYCKIAESYGFSC